MANKVISKAELHILIVDDNKVNQKEVYPGANDRLEKPIQHEELQRILVKANNQDVLVEAPLNERGFKTNSTSFFAHPKQASNQSKGRDFKEEEAKNICREFCTIL